MSTELKHEIAKLVNQVERLNLRFNQFVQDKKKKTYVNAEWVMRLTGWNAEELRQAREGKLIEFKSEPSKRHKYVLESIPSVFIINKAEKPATSDHLKKAV